MMQLAIPEDSIISSFDIVIKSIFEKIKKNQQEITHLTNLRDTLLPKLMSGEIDVNEVEI
jgi:type I restriction enzyme S subunit